MANKCSECRKFPKYAPDFSLYGQKYPNPDKKFLFSGTFCQSRTFYFKQYTQNTFDFRARNVHQLLDFILFSAQRAVCIKLLSFFARNAQAEFDFLPARYPMARPV